VPDYLTSVKEGQFYGWPFSYWGQYVDDRVKPQDPELVAKAGYKVVFVAFSDGKPTGAPVDVLTGFVSDSEKAFGRPVGVAVAKDGSLIVADDVGNTIWRVSQVAQTSTR
jgi:glucose/arabinose dehydrogenase